MQKRAHKLYNVKFDLFPADTPPVAISRGHVKRVLRKNEEEPACDRPEEELVEEPAQSTEQTRTNKRNYVRESLQGFLELDPV